MAEPLPFDQIAKRRVTILPLAPALPDGQVREAA
tara:strand:+ start:346 stop:447 length:102 start_codon:yes stop_codon:yes gene_type:complete